MPEAVLQRVITPNENDPAVLPLYAERVGTPFDVSSLGRTGFSLQAGSGLSTGTYFNAFPAAYWAHWTDVASVRLRLHLTGQGHADVHRSDSSGRSILVASVAVDGETTQDVVLDLAGAGRGGWVWFDLQAGEASLAVLDATYQAEGAPVPSDVVTVAITTFNRPDFCLALLRRLADSLDDLACINEVLVVDQGTRKVRDADGFSGVHASLGRRLRLVDQTNMGGSGGFARGMLETLASDRSRYVLLLDDDIAVEPESIVRAVTFAERCSRPTIVGGHMFSMSHRTSLHSFGEDVDRDSFWWGPAVGVTPDHDFATQSLRSTPWMHRRIDVGYNGWWMCLIPTLVLESVGLSQPFFIKWDDAEYGLRSRASGFLTVTLPGVAVWHVPWADKDDALDWQAYFHQRNRVVAALLHSNRRRGGSLPLSGLTQQIVHILAMQYSTAALRLRAVTDVEQGPEHLHPSLQRGPTRLNRIRAAYSDGQRGDVPDAPPLQSRPDLAALVVERPSKVWQVRQGLLGVVHQFSRVPAAAAHGPPVALTATQARWWLLGQLDGARVDTRERGEAVWYRRDRAQAWRLLSSSVRAYTQLWRRWPELRRLYRREQHRVTSPSTWSQTLGFTSDVRARETAGP